MEHSPEAPKSRKTPNFPSKLGARILRFARGPQPITGADLEVALADAQARPAVLVEKETKYDGLTKIVKPVVRDPRAQAAMPEWAVTAPVGRELVRVGAAAPKVEEAPAAPVATYETPSELTRRTLADMTRVQGVELPGEATPQSLGSARLGYTPAAPNHQWEAPTDYRDRLVQDMTTVQDTGPTVPMQVPNSPDHRQ